MSMRRVLAIGVLVAVVALVTVAAAGVWRDFCRGLNLAMAEGVPGCSLLVSGPSVEVTFVGRHRRVGRGGAVRLCRGRGRGDRRHWLDSAVHLPARGWLEHRPSSCGRNRAERERGCLLVPRRE